MSKDKKCNKCGRTSNVVNISQECPFCDVPLKDVKQDDRVENIISVWKKYFIEELAICPDCNGFSIQVCEKVLRDFMKTLLNNFDKTTATAVKRAREEQKKEDVRFILNILAGIDIADKETNNKGGGTKAIRMALQARFSDILPIIQGK